MKRNLIFLLLITFILPLMNNVNAQRSSNKSLGNLVTHEFMDNTLMLKTDYGKASVTVYDEGIIRVRIVKDDFIEKFSYAVEVKPLNAKVTFTEETKKLILQTSLIRLEINRNPVRFVFYSPDGVLLNEDDPSFGTSWIGTEVTTYKTLHKGERFLGLGEKTGNLDRRGSAYCNWNTDNPRYGPADDPLYVTIPFYIGVLNDQVYGIFFDNTHRSQFNFGASNDRFSSFGADDGEMDYYFIHDTNMSGIIGKYTWLTGRMSMPPLWSLGFQQCRWGYFPDTEVLNIARNFREKKIPLDVLYLDIHYMDAYKIFTWHPARFSNPAKMINDLKLMGIHTTVIIDPGIKVEQGYEAYEDGVKRDVFAKFPDGKLYSAQVWPGWCYFPDFTKPTVRQWWGNKFDGLVKSGVEGFWNDMNEIASWGGGFTPDLVDFNWEGEHATYRQAKNVYGMLMAKSTFEGTKKLMNNRRPLILTRAGYAGLQRYTALWTGDNQSTEEHMMLGTRIVNSLGLSGVSFAGVDVGGFGQDATPSLFARWISIGTFTPFFRSHSSYNTRQAEPWTFGEEVESICRDYISFRYKMLPYIYSAFHQSVVDGMPVSRSLAIDHTFDDKVYLSIYQQQYMFGPAFMVAPVESTKALTKVYLPAGNWYDLHNGKYYKGTNEIIAESVLNQLPVYVKAGSIIPLQKGAQYSSEIPGDTLFLHVFAGKEASSFDYYEDDGITYDYLKNIFYTRRITYDPVMKEITIEPVTGSFTSKFKVIEVLLHGFANEKFKFNGLDIQTQKTEVDLLNALPETDPLSIEPFHQKLPVLKFSINNDKGKMLVKW
ncbi:MAG: glycoside hydrolase family 31 protein [Lentimicrobiaceae bacterium]